MFIERAGSLFPSEKAEEADYTAMVSAEKSEAICILWGSGAGMEGPWRDLRTHLPA